MIAVAVDTKRTEEAPPAPAFRVGRRVSGFGVLAVGVLYAVGALLNASELRHAGLSVRDTLPLIPVQQMLGRGMALVYDNLPAVLFLGVTVVAGLVVGWIVDQRAEGLNDTLADRRRRNDLASAFIAVLVICFVATLFASRPAFALGIVPLVISAIVCVRRGARPFGHRVALVLVAWLLIVEVAAAVVNPQPLPSVSLKLDERSTVYGSLIASTGTTWYIGVGGHSFASIDASKVASARIESQGNRKTRLIYQYLGQYLGL